MTVEIVSTAAGLEAMEPEWWGLWERDSEATPFHSPAWLLPWWRVFGEGLPLSVAVRRHGELAGFAAFYRRREPGVRKLLPLGAGISDYLDPLDGQGRESAVGPAILAALADQRGSFDRADLMGQRGGSCLLDSASAGCTVAAEEPAPVLDLTAELPKPRLAKLDYYRRRAERLGSVRLETATAANLNGMLSALFALHRSRWQKKGGAGVLADPRLRAFHGMAARELLRRGLLRLLVLRIADRPAAAFYGFADRSRWHAYIGGFDSELPHPGLGAMLLGQVIELARDEGANELHLLRGREPYKYAWGAVDRPLWNLCLRPA